MLANVSSKQLSVRRAAVQVRPIRLSASRIAQTASNGVSSRVVITHASKPGSSVIDAPTVTTTPSSGTDSQNKKPPRYKVMLHNDSYNRREYVVKILLKICSITVDDAVVVMTEAHEKGVAMVVAVAQDVAEAYTEGLRSNGLVASMEPGC